VRNVVYYKKVCGYALVRAVRNGVKLKPRRITQHIGLRERTGEVRRAKARSLLWIIQECTMEVFLENLVVRTAHYIHTYIHTYIHVKNGVFWDDTPCGSCKNRCFG
jgi:hypothetical protein